MARCAHSPGVVALFRALQGVGMARQQPGQVALQAKAFREFERRRAQLQCGRWWKMGRRQGRVAAALRNAADQFAHPVESFRVHRSSLQTLPMQCQHRARPAITGHAAIDAGKRFEQALSLPAPAELEQDRRLGFDDPGLRRHGLESRVPAHRGDQFKRFAIAIRRRQHANAVAHDG